MLDSELKRSQVVLQRATPNKYTVPFLPLTKPLVIDGYSIESYR
jgi:hypothetical protein